jgi:ectoine hydroxylase-related dioxygenase (phytanoyl-CoA dioxygenase family)
MALDVERYKQTGYLHLPGFFDPAEVEALRREARRVFEVQLLRQGLIDRPDVDEAAFEAAMYRFFEQDTATFAYCGKQAQHLIALHRLSLDARIVEVLQELGLGHPVISTRPVLFFNQPRLAKKEVYWRLSAHQDWRSMQGSLDSVVVWVPLTDIDTRLGALEVVPGSHRLGLLESELIDGYGMLEAARFEGLAFEPCEVKQGDALFFSSFLVHRSGTNVTDAIRWSCHFRYNNLEEPTFIERGYPHPYLYKPLEPLLTPGFPAREAVEEIFA